MDRSLKGSCLCGRAQFQVDGRIEDVSHCHCSMCRKAHGAAFGTYANVPAALHRFISGEDVLKIYQSSPTAQRLFCSVCGSPMLWRDPVHFPGIASFPLGSLDSPVAVAAQRHIFVGSKATWHQITDHWPQSG